MTESFAARRVWSADDIAEYDRRVERLRELMGEHGFDAILLSDHNYAAPGERHGPPYARYISGFYTRIVPLFRRNFVVLVPASGDLTLVVSPGYLGSWSRLASTGSWIKKIVSSYIDDPSWEAKYQWGYATESVGTDVAQAVKESGLAEARIGVSGVWTGIEDTKAELPKAHFEPTVVPGADGHDRDLLEPLVGANSGWEIQRLERAQAAAEAAVTAFIETATEGNTYQEAVIAFRTAAIRGGAEDMMLAMTLATDPWTFWKPENIIPGSRYKTGELHTVEAGIVAVEGYAIQMMRSFVVGGHPSPAQQRVHDAIQRSWDVVFDRIKIGVTGGQLWDAALADVQKHGLEPWTRFGHFMGYGFNVEYAGTQRMNILPGDDHPVHEGLALVVHPAIRDRSTGVTATFGDTIVIENGVYRFLSDRPLSYALDGS